MSDKIVINTTELCQTITELLDEHKAELIDTQDAKFEEAITLINALSLKLEGVTNEVKTLKDKNDILLKKVDDLGGLIDTSMSNIHTTISRMETVKTAAKGTVKKPAAAKAEATDNGSPSGEGPSTAAAVKFPYSSKHVWFRAKIKEDPTFAQNYLSQESLTRVDEDPTVKAATEKTRPTKWCSAVVNLLKVDTTANAKLDVDYKKAKQDWDVNSNAELKQSPVTPAE